MTVAFLDLSRQLERTRSQIDAAVDGVLRRGRLVLGEAVSEFERAFAAYCGTREAVGVASGTDALALALRAVGLRPGDEVITAANTCVPTVAGIEQAGCVPVLVDAEPDSHCLDASALAAALGPRTRAIVPVHLYGQCADMDAIARFAREHGLRVVEDAAQAHGAEYRGRRAGSLGDAAAFSFYPTKNLGALGDAGAVVTDDEGVADNVRLLRSYGERERGLSLLRGGNSRLDELQAAVLSAKLRLLEGWNERRREIAARYLAALAGSGLGLPGELRERRHVYHLFVVRSPRRDEFRRALREVGVETLVHYPRPVHRHPAYQELGARGDSLAVSERLCAEVASLPLYPELEDREVERVCESVGQALDVVHAARAP